MDAVDIIVPPFLHSEMVIKAAAAGKHVYVEKPMVRPTHLRSKRLDGLCSRRLVVECGQIWVSAGAFARRVPFYD